MRPCISVIHKLNNNSVISSSVIREKGESQNEFLQEHKAGQIFLKANMIRTGLHLEQNWIIYIQKFCSFIWLFSLRLAKFMKSNGLNSQILTVRKSIYWQNWGRWSWWLVSYWKLSNGQWPMLCVILNELYSDKCSLNSFLPYNNFIWKRIQAY